MILIADSGSTKTDWHVKEGNETRRIVTKGINPFFQSEEEISNLIRSELLPELTTNTLDALYFYGAGCLPEKVAMMQKSITKCLDIKTLSINSDMLGAARGLCGKEPGIVGILGTGSNSCYYDGEKIVNNVSPLGFILGDEGSGAVLGKLFVGDILKNQMPSELKEKFLQRFDLTPALIIERVYRQPFPNRFLAGFAPFIAQNIEIPEVRTLVLNNFKSFLCRNIMQYDYRNNKVHFVGSVAYHFRELLEEASHEMGIGLGNIAISPMDGLIAYHS